MTYSATIFWRQQQFRAQPYKLELFPIVVDIETYKSLRALVDFKSYSFFQKTTLFFSKSLWFLNFFYKSLFLKTSNLQKC